jgi:hypothetical protein
MVTEVRAAVGADVLGVARVHVRSWQAAYQGIIDQDYLDNLKPSEMARRYTFERTGPAMPSTLVAVDGDSICGFATTAPSRDKDLPNVGEVRGFYVDPSQWVAEWDAY